MVRIELRGLNIAVTKDKPARGYKILRWPKYVAFGLLGLGSAYVLGTSYSKQSTPAESYVASKAAESTASKPAAPSKPKGIAGAQIKESAPGVARAPSEISFMKPIPPPSKQAVAATGAASVAREAAGAAKPQATFFRQLEKTQVPTECRTVLNYETKTGIRPSGVHWTLEQHDDKTFLAFYDANSDGRRGEDEPSLHIPITSGYVDSITRIRAGYKVYVTFTEDICIRDGRNGESPLVEARERDSVRFIHVRPVAD